MKLTLPLPRLRLALALVAGLLLWAPGPAMADSVDTDPYVTVKALTGDLHTMRSYLQVLLGLLTERKTELERIEREIDAMPVGSNDRTLAQARLDTRRDEVLAEVTALLDKLCPLFQESRDGAKRETRHLLDSGDMYDSLVSGHLAGNHNPAVLSLLVFLAIDKLSSNLATLRGDVNLDQITRFIHSTERAMEMAHDVADLGEDRDTRSLLSSLMDEDGDGEQGLDELDRRLQGE